MVLGDVNFSGGRGVNVLVSALYIQHITSGWVGSHPSKPPNWSSDPASSVILSFGALSQTFVTWSIFKKPFYVGSLLEILTLTEFMFGHFGARIPGLNHLFIA